MSSPLSASSLLSFTLLFFIPIQLYLTNSIEFDFMFPDLLVLLLLFAGALAILLGTLLALLPSRFSLKQRGENLVFSLGFLLWLQSSVLVWNYGPLDGRQISWGEKATLGLVDGAVWIAMLALAQVKLEFFSRILKRAAWALLLLQLFFSSFYYFDSPPFPTYNEFNFSKNGQFDFSAKKNVIILVVDCFQSDLFQEIIDEDSSWKETFAGFTYFRNALGGFPTTYASVPLILTGRYYDNSLPIQRFIKKSYLSPSSLPWVLGRRGVQVALFPPVRKVVLADPGMAMNLIKRPFPFLWSEFGMLLDISLFRGMPHFGKRLVFNEQKWFVRNLVPKKPFTWLKPKDRKARDFEEPVERQNAATGVPKGNHEDCAPNEGRDALPRGSLRIPDVNFLHHALKSSSSKAAQATFKYYHLLGIHAPFSMNENLEPVRLAHTRANGKRLARGELLLVKMFILKLKDLGILDDSLVIVMGDHGHPRGKLGRVLPRKFSGSNPRFNRMPAGVIEGGTPLLLAKQFGAGGEMKISDAPVGIADIARTIFAELRIPTACPGESIFSMAESAVRPRFYYFYTWSRDDWKSEYLPPLIEYRVDGHAWLDGSWRATGRVLRPH